MNIDRIRVSFLVLLAIEIAHYYTVSTACIVRVSIFVILKEFIIVGFHYE